MPDPEEASMTINPKNPTAELVRAMTRPGLEFLRQEMEALSHILPPAHAHAPAGTRDDADVEADFDNMPV